MSSKVNKRKAEKDETKSGKKKKTSQDKSESKKSNGSTTTPNRPTSYPKLIDDSTNFESDEKIEYTEPLPKRSSNNELVFPDWPDFRPNMTPKEVMQAGSFGGTYFRPIKSGATKKSYTGVWKELPKDWLEGLNIGRQVSCSTYDEKVNTYKAKCGGSLEMWESSDWIHKQDPYGWFQWYCRFYQGRRTADDACQVGRWLRCAGKTGRWKNNLIAKCVRSKCAYDNAAISPVVRQTLQHWGYRLTKEDHDAHAKVMKKKGQV